jgi:hypothetical protein
LSYKEFISSSLNQDYNYKRKEQKRKGKKRKAKKKEKKREDELFPIMFSPNKL